MPKPRNRVKAGFKTRPVGVAWTTLLEIWELGDAMELFDSGWLFDHFAATVEPEGFGSHEGWSIAAALAAKTRRLQFGHLVLGNTYRHPALLAKMAATVDHIAQGRFVLGLGAGWHEAEHEMFGWEFPTVGQRISRLEASVQILRGLWQARDPWSFQGAGYRVTEAQFEPPPYSNGGPPIWLGTQGRQRGLRIVAQYADGWNTNAYLDDSFLDAFIDLRGVLLRHCESVGRDPDEIEISAQVLTAGRPTNEVIAQGRGLARAGVDHLVFLIDARLGPGELERVGENIVRPIVEV